MTRDTRFKWIVGGIITLVLLVVCVVAACNTTPDANPSPSPTQECIEPDGEPCDDDPLDLDDLNKKKTPPVKKSTCVKTKRNTCR